MQYIKNLTFIMILVVFIAIPSAVKPDPEFLSQCKANMKRFYSNINDPLLSCLKHAVKKLLGYEFKHERLQFNEEVIQLAEDYFYVPINQNLVIHEKIRTPTTFCNTEFPGMVDCTTILLNAFESDTDKSVIYVNAHLFHKQAESSIKVVISPFKYYYLHPSSSYVFAYLEDIAKHIDLKEDILWMHRTPSNFCERKFNPKWKVLEEQDNQENHANQTNNNV